MSEAIRSMPKHERMKLPRQSMPTQEAQVRAHNLAIWKKQPCSRLSGACSASGPNA
jgi:hypothetical protein